MMNGAQRLNVLNEAERLSDWNVFRVYRILGTNRF